MSEVFAAMDRQNIIAEGDSVILKKGKNMKVYKVLRRVKVFLDKRTFALEPIIGHPYGTSWELQNQRLVPFKKTAESHDLAGKIDQGGADNRGIFDDDTSQKLDKDNIMDLKEQGKTGQEIVDHLVENSSTFNEKTVYSKAKYLKKKQNKYIMKFVVLRPSTRLLCEMYFNKSPSKHVQLRIDTVAQLLSASNVQSGSRVMVLEHCQGLLVGAVMERLGGTGNIVQFYTEDMPCNGALQAFNFPAHFKETLQTFSLKDVYNILLKPENETRAADTENQTAVAESESSSSCRTVKDDESTTKDSVGEGEAVSMETDMNENGGSDGPKEGGSVTVTVPESKTPTNAEESQPGTSQDASSGASTAVQIVTEPAAVDCSSSSAPQPFQDERRALKRKENHERKDEKKKVKLEAALKTKELLLERNMDTLLIATKFHPAPVLLALIDCLALSRPFAIFSPYKEPLTECYVKLRDRGDVISLRVTETWHREYQVLPDRTHPLNSMNNYGGYILSGLHVGNGTS